MGRRGSLGDERRCFGRVIGNMVGGRLRVGLRDVMVSPVRGRRVGRGGVVVVRTGVGGVGEGFRGGDMARVLV